jgi:3-hydroxyisobutyrate dehydrogenase-like beta-hydroxyacid dehydrogenase
VRDVRTWRPDGDGGFTAHTEVGATIFGRAAVVLGTSTLAADGSGTLATWAARVTVDAPVVGRQAENAVGQLVAVVLRREAELLRRRLADGGRASSTP